MQGKYSDKEVVLIIDIETAQFNKVKIGIASLCTNCGTVEPEAPLTATSYLSFAMKDNPIYRKTSDSDKIENHVQPMIQIDVFSEISLHEAKQIMKLADAVMVGDGWERTFLQPIQLTFPFRMTARYQAVVEETTTGNFRVYSN